MGLWRLGSDEVTVHSTSKVIIFSSLILREWSLECLSDLWRAKPRAFLRQLYEFTNFAL